MPAAIPSDTGREMEYLPTELRSIIAQHAVPFMPGAYQSIWVKDYPKEWSKITSGEVLIWLRQCRVAAWPIRDIEVGQRWVESLAVEALPDLVDEIFNYWFEPGPLGQLMWDLANAVLRNSLPHIQVKVLRSLGPHVSSRLGPRESALGLPYRNLLMVVRWGVPELLDEYCTRWNVGKADIMDSKVYAGGPTHDQSGLLVAAACSPIPVMLPTLQRLWRLSKSDMTATNQFLPLFSIAVGSTKWQKVAHHLGLLHQLYHDWHITQSDILSILPYIRSDCPLSAIVVTSVKEFWNLDLSNLDL